MKLSQKFCSGLLIVLPSSLKLLQYHQATEADNSVFTQTYITLTKLCIFLTDYLHQIWLVFIANEPLSYVLMPSLQHYLNAILSMIFRKKLRVGGRFRILNVLHNLYAQPYLRIMTNAIRVSVKLTSSLLQPNTIRMIQTTFFLCSCSFIFSNFGQNVSMQ